MPGTEAPVEIARALEGRRRGADDVDFEVVVVGAGFSGIGAAIKLKQAGIDDFAILDEREDVGGVWLVNTYPGVAVDVPSFTYSFPFEPNPGWSRAYAPGPELKRYADHCVDKYGLRPHLRLNMQVVEAAFDEHRHAWRITTGTGGSILARYLISATGVLTQPKEPDIAGLDTFAGTIMHTADWDHTQDLRGKRVAVVGTGASAIQVVPALAADLEKLFVYQRTPIWVLPKPDFAVPGPLRTVFRYLPGAQRAARGATDGFTEAVLVLGVTRFRQFPFLIEGIQRVSQLHLRMQVRDPLLRAKLQPDYGFGCKRPSLSNTYWRSFNRDNVELVTDGIERITPAAIRTLDGSEQQVDALVLATGFHVTEKMPPFPILGEGGVDLGEFWRAKRFQAYRGAAVAGYPNLWFIFGPYAFNGGSWFSMIEYQTTHLIRVITEARTRGATRAAVRQDAHDQAFAETLRRQQDSLFFNNHCEGANSYYFDANGDAPLVNPSSSREAARRARTFPLDDYEFTTRSLA